MRKTVQDAMSSDPVTIGRSDSVAAAARLMESADIGSVPVVDGGSPVGIVTDRDIAIRVVAHGMDPELTPKAAAYSWPGGPSGVATTRRGSERWPKSAAVTSSSST